jgi:hypothetical protein
MKSTTIRFADPVYGQLELASRLTGLPINSIVTVACLDWLRQSLPQMPASALGRGLPSRWMPASMRSMMERQTVPVAAPPLAGSDPLWIFTASAQDALANAHEEAERARHSWIGTEHLLSGLYAVEEGRAGLALRELGVDAERIRADLEPEQVRERSGRLLPTSRLLRVLRRAHEQAQQDEAKQVGTDHLRLGLVLEGESRVAEALEAAGVTERTVRDALSSAQPEA